MERNSWFKQEFDRAKKRNAKLPAHARMVVTNPVLSAHSRAEAPVRKTPNNPPQGDD